MVDYTRWKTQSFKAQVSLLFLLPSPFSYWLLHTTCNHSSIFQLRHYFFSGSLSLKIFTASSSFRSVHHSLGMSGSVSRWWTNRRGPILNLVSPVSLGEAPDQIKWSRGEEAKGVLVIATDQAAPTDLPSPLTCLSHSPCWIHSSDCECEWSLFL